MEVQHRIPTSKSCRLFLLKITTKDCCDKPPAISGLGNMTSYFLLASREMSKQTVPAVLPYVLQVNNASSPPRKERLTNRFCNQKRPLDVWGRGFCTGRFFCHKKHRFLNTQDFKEFLYSLTADLVKFSMG